MTFCSSSSFGFELHVSVLMGWVDVSFTVLWLFFYSYLILFTLLYAQMFSSPQREWQDAGLQEFCEKCSMKAIKMNFSVQMPICIILIYI